VEEKKLGARTRFLSGEPAVVVWLCFAVLFICGFIAVLNHLLIAELRRLFSLTYMAAMLTQFAFYVGYVVFSIPSGIILSKFGCIRGIILGLAAASLGCALSALAARTGSYNGFLIALFMLAAGMVVLQAAIYTYILMSSSVCYSHSRLTLASAFNSMGRFLSPIFGGIFLFRQGAGSEIVLDHSAAVRGAASIQIPFLVASAVLLAFVFLYWPHRNTAEPLKVTANVHSSSRRIWGQPRFVLGVLSIFLYVGAEVSIGSGLVNYLMQKTVIGNQSAVFGNIVAALLGNLCCSRVSIGAIQVAGVLVSIYWGLAMVGRFVGTVILTRVAPGYVLFCNALAATVLALISALSGGVIAAVSALVIGLANSIMFPTIFALALEKLGEATPQGAAILCMAIIGGAVVPVIFGAVADQSSISIAFIVPAVCYGVIAAYGWLTSMRHPVLFRVNTP
jgi:MFS transporter, FHS family, L-fucose permease